MNKLPFLDLRTLNQEFRVEITSVFNRVVDSGCLILLPEYEKIEKSFVEYCGAKHYVWIDNGQEALQPFLHAAGIGVRDEIILPLNIYIATWLEVFYARGAPIPAEVKPTSLNIEPSTIERKISPKTNAHLYGRARK